MITDTKARKAKAKDTTYRLADSGGLALEIRPSGSKFWRYRYRLHGKAGMFTVGEYPTITISEARAIRDWAKKCVANGEAPAEVKKRELAERQAEQANTLEEVGKEWIARNKASWSPYYYRQVDRMLAADIWPTLGKKAIRDITPAQILAELQKVEERAPTIAVNLKQWLAAIYRHAIATLRADNDPTAPLRGAIKKPKPKHKPSYNLDEFGKLCRAIWPKEEAIAYRITEIAIRMLALTMVRTVEVRKAQWDQFDLESAEPTWTVPGENMKRGVTHVVPLSTQAVALMRELQGLTGNRLYCFPNLRQPTEPMSPTTINRVLDRLGYSGLFSGHAFRTTASTLLNTYGFDADWIERQLAHSPGNKVRASYNHAQYLEQRRIMLQWWADLVDTLRLHGATSRPSVPPLPAIVRRAIAEGYPDATAYPTASDDHPGKALH